MPMLKITSGQSVDNVVEGSRIACRISSGLRGSLQNRDSFAMLRLQLCARQSLDMDSVLRSAYILLTWCHITFRMVEPI